MATRACRMAAYDLAEAGGMELGAVQSLRAGVTVSDSYRIVSVRDFK